MGKDLNGKELGTGLYQRKDGRYEGRYKDRYGKTKSVYDKSLRIVKSERKRLEREERFADPYEKPMIEYTLNEWADVWLDTYKHHVSAASQSRYKRAYLNHVAPVLGEKPIASITNVDITRMINTLGGTFRIQTVQFITNLTYDIFDKALLNDVIRKNPVRGVQASGLASKDRRVLTKEEQDTFLAASKGHIYENAFIVALHTGLRCGELFALRWSDIDLKQRKLKVTRSLMYRTQSNGKCDYQINPPKTKKSIRTVYFDDVCAEALQRQFEKRLQIVSSDSYDPVVGYEDLLFVTKVGTPILTQFASSAISHIIDRINKNREDGTSEFEHFGMHCFRHTYATRCFEAGLSPRIIQEQLGHATMHMTMDLYTHVLDDHRAQEVDKLNQYYA